MVHWRQSRAVWVNSVCVCVHGYFFCRYEKKCFYIIGSMKSAIERTKSGQTESFGGKKNIIPMMTMLGENANERDKGKYVDCVCFSEQK